MKYLIEILLHMIFLFNESEQNDKNILLTNDLTSINNQFHIILKSRNRVKREKSTFNIPSDHASNSHEQYDEHIYNSLHNCVQFISCVELSPCLKRIHRKSNEKSYGSLILHLLDLLGIDNCDDHDIKSSCSSDRRSAIFHHLFVYWSYSKQNNIDGDYDETSAEPIYYCHTIINLIHEVKNVIKNYCSIYTSQVEAFLEKYLCSIGKHDKASTIVTNSIFDEPLNRHKLHARVRKISTISSRIAYSDEDENLSSFTDPFTYINDRQYYNITYTVSKFEELSPYYVEDDKNFTSITTLHGEYYNLVNVNLTFSFPFYGHNIDEIFLSVEGVLFATNSSYGNILISQQYISPFMADFDPLVTGNESEIKYYQNSTHFICTWKNLYLLNQRGIGSFTFQVVLQMNGNIYFNYLKMPLTKLLRETNGLNTKVSNMFISQHTTYQHENQRHASIFKDKLDLDKTKIKNGVTVIFTLCSTCNTFTDCQSCLTSRDKRLSCSWCDYFQSCFDNNDSSQHEFVQSKCRPTASKNTCFDNFKDTTYINLFKSSSSDIHSINVQPRSYEEHATLYTLRTIVITLLLTVLILAIVVLVSTYIYAYRNPTSPPGMWLLEHRPSNFIARFKNFSDINNSSY